MNQNEIPWWWCLEDESADVQKRKRGERPFEVGDLVTVHQGSLNLVGGVKAVLGPCSEHAHWNSRILAPDRIGRGWLWAIATQTNGGRNRSHAEWPYSEKVLSHRDDADWALESRIEPGMKILGENPHIEIERPVQNRRLGKSWIPPPALSVGVVEIAHIAPGDWYVSFPTVRGDWRFRVVINEKDFEIL